MEKQFIEKQKKVSRNFVSLVFLNRLKLLSIKKIREQIGLTKTEMAKLMGLIKHWPFALKGLCGINPKALIMLSTIEVLMKFEQDSSYRKKLV